VDQAENKESGVMKAILNATAGAMLCAYLAAVPASAQQFTIKISSPTVNDLTHEWMKAFKSGVEARAGGRIKVEMYPANQLGQIPATVEGVALGTIEVEAPATGFLLGLEPRFQLPGCSMT
jgi:TRAP-type C4-dicarboxylate transport system substrate-binding protein